MISLMTLLIFIILSLIFVFLLIFGRKYIKVCTYMLKHRDIFGVKLDNLEVEYVLDECSM